MLFRKIKNVNYERMSLVYTSPQGNQLWLGDYYAATDISLLKSKGIKNVLTVAAMLGIKYPKEQQINHKVINAFDIPTYKMTPHFQQAFEFIKNSLKGGNILVHCAAGISRSTTCVIVYLMKEKGFSYSFSLEYVRKKRLIVKPNYGFQNELTQLERQLKKRGVLSSNSTIANEDGGSRIHNKNSYRRNIYNSLNNRSENAVSGNLNLNLNANLNLKITNFSRGGSLNKRKTIGSDHLFYPGLKLNNKLLQVKRQL